MTLHSCFQPASLTPLHVIPVWLQESTLYATHVWLQKLYITPVWLQKNILYVTHVWWQESTICVTPVCRRVHYTYSCSCIGLLAYSSDCWNNRRLIVYCRDLRRISFVLGNMLVDITDTQSLAGLIMAWGRKPRDPAVKSFGNISRINPVYFFILPLRMLCGRNISAQHHLIKKKK